MPHSSDSSRDIWKLSILAACLQEIQVLNRDLKEQKKTADEFANQLENRPSLSLHEHGLVFPVLCSVACMSSDALREFCITLVSGLVCRGLAWFGQEMYQVGVEFRLWLPVGCRLRSIEEKAHETWEDLGEGR